MKREKILVISDLHLTTNFIKKKYNFLEKLILNADKVVINGDFWSYYYNTFDEFLSTNWKGLFPLLLEKETVYVYGNHDQGKWSDERVKRFSVVQGNDYLLKTGGKKYLLTHGHLLLDNKSIEDENFTSFWRKYHVDVIKYFVEAFFLRTIGRTFYLFAKKFNDGPREMAKKRKDIDFLVIGHLHWSELDRKNKFINTGLIHAGVADYLIIEDGEPKIVNTRY